MSASRINIGERGISAVMGTVLLVATVVVLVGFASAMLLGFDTPVEQPTAAFEVNVEGNDVVIQHETGDAIDPSQLTVSYGDTQHQWSSAGGANSGDVSAGDSISLPANNTGQLTLRWAGPNNEQSYILYSTFVAPEAAVTITDIKFADSYSGWSDKHLDDEGYSPEGHFREIHTKDEMQFRKGGIGTTTVTDYKSISPAPSGDTRPLTLTYDGSEFVYKLGGKTMSSSQIAVEENAIAVMAKNRDSDVSTVNVNNIRLNGQPVGRNLSVTTSDKAESIIIEAEGIENGFKLTADVTYSYSGSVSDGEAIGIRVEIA